MSDLTASVIAVVGVAVALVFSVAIRIGFVSLAIWLILYVFGVSTSEWPWYNWLLVSVAWLTMLYPPNPAGLLFDSLKEIGED